MTRLVVIRHAETRVDPAVAAHQWSLAERAHDSCRQLAARLESLSLSRIVTSEELKAAETGRMIAEALGVPYESAPGLQEHDRTGVPVMEPDEWRLALTTFFGRPDSLVLGKATALASRDRFAAALGRVLADHGGERLAVVSHATVISLFVAAHNPVDAYAFWQTLKMPDAVVLSLPGFRLQT